MPDYGSEQLGDMTSAWPVKTKIRVYYIYCVGNQSVDMAVKFWHVVSKWVTTFRVACDYNKWVKQVNCDENRVASVITFIQIHRQTQVRAHQRPWQQRQGPFLFCWVARFICFVRRMWHSKDTRFALLKFTVILTYDNVTPEQHQVKCKNRIDLK